MKANIHPTYHKTIVTCACGNTFETGSTVKEITVELCSACHPFYTGKQKIVDTAGRIDRFKKRAAQKSTAAKTRIGRKAKRERTRVKKNELS